MTPLMCWCGIAVPQAETAQRQPIDLALAIDVSGSMSGLPLQLAKAATKLILRQLKENDRIALVTFHNNAEIALPCNPLLKRRLNT